MSQPAACACGQVLFDVGDKKPNDVLTCPWCDRKYKYLGDGKVESLDPKDAKNAKGAAKSTSDDKKKPEKSEANSKDDAKKDPEKKPDARDKKAEDRKAGHAAAADLLRKVDDKRPRLAGTAKHDPMTLEGNRTSVRKSRKGEIPGGVGVMVCFIVAFNALAFIALKFLLPAQADGTRITPWHTEIPKSAIWPEIVALLVGHFVGFIAWSTFLYYRQKKLNRQIEQQSQPTQVPQ